MRTYKIAVLGSINMDLVCQVRDFPKPGETITAKDFKKFSGGKGANQAVGVAKLGKKVKMFGAVGKDNFGEELLHYLEEYKVNTDHVKSLEGSSGLAVILINHHGENTIAITPGANGKIDMNYITERLDEIKQFRILLLQFEIPFSSTCFLLDHLPSHRPLIILDPSPARDLSGMGTERVDILTPNLRELETIANMSLSKEERIKVAGLRLIKKQNIKAVICKAGQTGSFLITRETFKHFPPLKVNAVDTTGAGDAFNAALAVALSENKTLEDSIRYANIAGALTTTKLGVQSSLPNSRELAKILKNERST